jgi:ABC-type spermidine/putrescine transport system permease subunit II
MRAGDFVRGAVAAGLFLGLPGAAAYVTDGTHLGEVLTMTWLALLFVPGGVIGFGLTVAGGGIHNMTPATVALSIGTTFVFWTFVFAQVAKWKRLRGRPPAPGVL